MDTNDLRSFQYVYEYRSINAAAKALFMSPQGLSKQIQSLENELGTALFRRSSKGMTPTKCGTLLYRNASVFTSFYDQMKCSIRDGCRDLFLPLTIPVSTGTLGLLSVDFLTGLRKAYPDIPVKITEYSDEDVVKLLDEGGSSVGIVSGTADTTMFSAEFLFRARPCVMMPAGHPFTVLEKIDFEHLHNMPVCLTGSEFGYYRLFMNRCLQAEAHPIIKYELPNLEAVHQMVERRETLGITLQEVADRDTPPGVVTRPLGDDFYLDYWLIHKRGTIMSKEAAAFCTYASEFLKTGDGSLS